MNNLRMDLKNALDNLWSRIIDIWETVKTREDNLAGDMIKTISLNGVNVPKDAQGNVALQETDPTVPAWAKHAKAKTSDFTNDGDGTDNNSPFATQEYVRQNGGKIDEIRVNNVTQAIVNKMVNIRVPTSLDDLDDALYVEINGTATNIHDQLSGLGNGGFTFFKAEHPEMDMLLGKAMPSKYVYGTLVGTIVNCPLPDGTDQYYLNGYYNYYDGQGNEEETGVAVSHFDFTDETHGGYSLYVYDSAIISNGGSGGGGGSGAVDTVTFNGVTYQPDSNGNVSFGFAETDPTVPSWAKAAQKPSYTASEVGAKPTQTAVADPTASGTAVAFIAGITQNAKGVISPTKKTVRSASQSESGLMSAADKIKLDGIAAGAQVNSVTSVNNQTGAISVTPENIGALPISGGTMTGDIDMGQAGASSGASSVKWRTADGTLFMIRPYNNVFQLVRTPVGGSMTSVLTIHNDGTVSVNPQDKWRTAIGAAKANSEFYTAIGDIVKSYSDAGTAVGYGMAFVSIRGKTVTVEFEAQITTAGSVSNVYDIGMSVERLRALNSSIPAFTVSDGIIHYFKSTGEIDTYHEGYAGVGKAVTNQQRWGFSRIYNTSGAIGPWSDSAYNTLGTCIMGTLYGTLT